MKPLQFTKILFLSTTLFSTSLWALDTERFANCSAAYNQLDAAKADLNDGARLSEMDNLINDVQNLVLQLKKKSSSDVSFALKKCLDKKKQALAAHIQKISDPERTKAKFNKLMGKLNTSLEKHDEALKYYRLATKYDPQDYEAFSDGFNSWLITIYKKIATSARQMSIKDVQDIIEESDAFIMPIWNNQQAPLPLRIRMLRLRAQFLEARGRQAEAIVDWKRIYAADPKNLESLFKIADFEYSRGRRQEAYGLYNKLSQLQPKNSLVLSRLVELGFEKGDLAITLTNSKKAYETKPSDISAGALYAKALALNGRSDEAKKVNSEILKKDSKNTMARETQGTILEFEGDLAQKGGLISKALLSYKEALQYNPNKITLRIKMAKILYEYRKAQNFQPKEASQKDMDEAVSLLAPAIHEDFLIEEVGILMILSASKSSKISVGEKTCKRYEKEYGIPGNLNAVLGCVSIYKSSNKISTARDLAERALSDLRFSQEAQEITKVIDSLR